MGWVLENPKHKCDLPHRDSAGVGSLWRCEACGKLWQVHECWIGPRWMRASVYNRIKHRGK